MDSVIKNKLFEILGKEVSEVSEFELSLIDRYLTYELLDEYITTSGVAIDVDGMTDSVTLTLTGSDILYYYKSKDNEFRTHL